MGENRDHPLNSNQEEEDDHKDDAGNYFRMFDGDRIDSAALPRATVRARSALDRRMLRVVTGNSLRLGPRGNRSDE